MKLQKVFCALLAAAALCLTACSAQPPAVPSETNTAPVMTPEAAATPETTPDETAAEAYEALLAKYREGIRQGWEPMQFEEAELCYLCGIVPGEEMGYRIADINGDGVDELIVACDSTILDLYTLSGGSPVRVLSGGERNAYTLCAGGVLCNQGAISAASSVEAYFALEGVELKTLRRLVFDTDTLYDCGDAEGDVPGKPITEEEAAEIRAQYPAQALDLTPLVRNP